MFATKIGRAWTIYLCVGLLTFILLVVSEAFDALPSDRRDWLVIAVGATLYVLAYAVVLPFWNARAGRRATSASIYHEKQLTQSASFRGRWIATGVLLALAVTFTLAQLRMSVRFSDPELRDSTIILMPALNAFLCAIAILLVPPGPLGTTLLLKVIFAAKWTVLVAFAITGVLISPALMLLTWEAYDFQTYAGSVRPAWLVLPAAALMVRICVHYTRNRMGRDRLRNV